MSTQAPAAGNVSETAPEDIAITEAFAEGETPLEACPSFVAAMTIIGQRWSGLIIQALAKGCSSFTEISHFAEKLSDASLSRRLKQLEAEGLLVRTVTQDRPTRVRYTLTEAGKALAPVLNSLTDWGEHYVRHGNVTPPARRRHVA
ncbi:helix-turn-helix domain-containing protein [uncultured Bifidobacterium sp.]|uniref:winged helix-turn-helix transcriptional regulator n=1 Tax=uncultured Bifidobacterium sp. TaxID=165187 RepID=UPI0028DCCD12|nr:helix-turn-helix domain-containing protein [uncultured Bifidobacterium sp.]